MKMKVASHHYVLKGNRMQAPFPKGIETCVFGTGCFWGPVRTASTHTVHAYVHMHTHVSVDLDVYVYVQVCVNVLHMRVHVNVFHIYGARC